MGTPGVMWAAGGFEMGIRRAKSLPETLKELASIKVSSLVGCLW